VSHFQLTTAQHLPIIKAVRTRVTDRPFPAEATALSARIGASSNDHFATQ